MGVISQGKTQGWLQLPPEALRPWALANGVDFADVKAGHIEGRGAALLAAKPTAISPDEPQRLMTVPRDLILSLERVQEHAKVDKDYREVLESVGDFGRTPRGAVLTFLLVQCAVACPNLPRRVGVHSPFTDYIRFVPCELLPTFWALSELQLLTGTTLAPAISSKLRSLRGEYDLLCSSASNTRWYRIIQDHLEFDDWLQVDAMYRSRALDFPGVGHCMVPCIDLANHASHEATVAVYEKDEDGNAVLLLRQGKQIREGEEVTITYGDEKGACEMLFSYGFLEEPTKSAETVFLNLTIPDTDVQRTAKLQIADSAPGFKLIDIGDGEVDWKGDFIWLLCVNSDDGLRFQLARTVDGADEEMHGFFGNKELTGGAAELYKLLGQSALWDVYHLRAIAILQQRVFEQLQVLYGAQEQMEGVPFGEGTGVRERPHGFAMTLRALEFELLNKAYEDFEKQKLQLAGSDAVTKYLAKINDDSGEQQLKEDLS